MQGTSSTTLLSLEWWETGLTFGSRIIGVLTAAPVADSIGRRNTLLIAMAISLVAITMEIVATTNTVFLGGKLLSGMAVAAIESTSGAYLAEARSDSPLVFCLSDRMSGLSQQLFVDL